jgi:hypothetical protein
VLQLRTLRIIWIFIVAWGWQNVRVQAQLPHPRIFSISPNGGTAGSVIELTLTSGEDLDEVHSLILEFRRSRPLCRQMENRLQALRPFRFTSTGLCRPEFMK